MKKRYFYPIWKLDELDNELSKMEQNGFRLDKVSHFRTFHFVKSKPRDVQYFTTYTFVRERGMATTEQSLKEKGANRISASLDGWGLANIFRITNSINLKEKLEWRNIYLQHVVYQKFLIPLCFCIFSLTCTFLQMYLHGLNPIIDIISILITTVSAIFTIYNLYGLIFLKKQYKNYCSK
ncbi:MAG: DUF2812 domain-containing protein [Ruminococcus sp.]|nr:DUF2812 domain-containing protein [Ruminococcus sp.]